MVPWRRRAQVGRLAAKHKLRFDVNRPAAAWITEAAVNSGMRRSQCEYVTAMNKRLRACGVAASVRVLIKGSRGCAWRSWKYCRRKINEPSLNKRHWRFFNRNNFGSLLSLLYGAGLSGSKSGKAPGGITKSRNSDAGGVIFLPAQFLRLLFARKQSFAAGSFNWATV